MTPLSDLRRRQLAVAIVRLRELAQSERSRCESAAPPEQDSSPPLTNAQAYDRQADALEAELHADDA